MAASLAGSHGGLGSVTSSTGSTTGRHFAFVVGINAYAHLGRLKQCVNDAEDMTQVLASAGYRVTTLKDPTKLQMAKEFEHFLTTVPAEGAQVVVHYSGHGAEASGNNYLLPIDGIGEWWVLGLFSCRSMAPLAVTLFDCFELACYHWYRHKHLCGGELDPGVTPCTYGIWDSVCHSRRLPVRAL